MNLKETPIGTFDAFKDVKKWDEETAQNWKNALNLRAVAPDQQKLRDKIIELAAIKKSDTAIEIGCGTGALLCDLAQVVGESGTVIGFEPQKTLAAEAVKRAKEIGVSDFVKVRDESGEKLSVDDNFADACLAQTVLIHLPDKTLKKTLAEMTRVTKKGGQIVSCDQDGDTWIIDHPNRELTRKIVKFNSDQRYADGWTGRHLRRLFGGVNLTEINIETVVHADMEKDSYLHTMAVRIANAAAEVGFLTVREKNEWIKMLNEFADAGNFFSSINYYLCSGRKK